jgi:hypothetical protein
VGREINETLYAYAHFLGEPTEYVLNQVIDTVLSADKDFLQWRAEHPESFVARGVDHYRRHAARSDRARVGTSPAGNP